MAGMGQGGPDPRNGGKLASSAFQRVSLQQHPSFPFPSLRNLRVRRMEDQHNYSRTRVGKIDRSPISLRPGLAMWWVIVPVPDRSRSSICCMVAHTGTYARCVLWPRPGVRSHPSPPAGGCRPVVPARDLLRLLASKPLSCCVGWRRLLYGRPRT